MGNAVSRQQSHSGPAALAQPSTQAPPHESRESAHAGSRDGGRETGAAAGGVWRTLAGAAWFAWPWVLPLLIVGGWTLASTQQWISPAFLPTPLRTVASFWDMLVRQSYLQDFWVSVSLVVQSFVLGALAAVVLGFAAGLWRPVERFFGPTLDTIRHIPGVAWFPLIVLWLGVGTSAKTLVIAKTVFFPVFLNTLQGIRNADARHIELGRALTLTRLQQLRYILIPSALPTIMVSLRYSAGLAWAMVVVAEGLAGQEGIGFLIFRAQSLLMTDQLLVCMATIGVVGFLIDRGMYAIQRHALRWKTPDTSHGQS
ncbi:ABC transporter permease [Burkholderia sp. WAC0059]|uniref:ABC transporter permease n=1 Tax=Burkholderia sp. WAC0059 TaxID=2066022 RepID=UPI000C7EA41E|nr:ABC transporter permease [Burkholderia sp. WAC0059]PLZ00614.1 ABC transporter permease [Burkholderia sp. WAC0059]